MAFENRVTINLQFNGAEITLPVNPENLKITKAATNSNINIVGIGPAARKGQPGLTTLQLSSFFPHPFSAFYKYDRTPEEYIDMINEWWNTENINNNVPKLVTYGLEKNIKGMPVVIDNFEYEYKGGDLDVWYKLSLKEYVPYGVKNINESFTAMAAARPESIAIQTTPNDGKYTVTEGQSLYDITKLLCGDGSKWKALYDLNKDIIGTDPEVLQGGLVLTIPSDWTISKAATKSGAAKTSGSGTGTGQQKGANSTITTVTKQTTTQTAKESNAIRSAELWQEVKKTFEELQKVYNSKRGILSDRVLKESVWTALVADQMHLDSQYQNLQNAYNKAANDYLDNSKTEAEHILDLEKMIQLEAYIAKDLKGIDPYAGSGASGGHRFDNTKSSGPTKEDKAWSKENSVEYISYMREYSTYMSQLDKQLTNISKNYSGSEKDKLLKQAEQYKKDFQNDYDKVLRIAEDSSYSATYRNEAIRKLRTMDLQLSRKMAEITTK